MWLLLLKLITTPKLRESSSEWLWQIDNAVGPLGPLLITVTAKSSDTNLEKVIDLT